MVSYILAVIVAAIVLAADQITKFLVSTNFEILETRKFLPGFLNFTYLYNTGGAWGMLSDRTWLLLSVTIVVMLVCMALLLKCGVKDKLMFWAIMLILSGGIGNMIDRIFRDGKVIDFLQFDFDPLKNFPVFNIADCAIVVGAGMLMLYFFMDMIKENKQKRLNSQQIISDSNKNEKD